MRLSHFFIERPVFATVLSLILMIAGAIAQQSLPISEYPEIVPPTVNIKATYPAPPPKSSRKRWPPRSSRR